VIVDGQKFNVRRLYQAPALPADTQFALADPAILSVLTGRESRRMTADLASNPGATQPGRPASKVSGALGAQPSTLQNDRERREMLEVERNVVQAQEAAFVAQQQLAADVNAIETYNGSAATTNDRVLFVLNNVTGEDYGTDIEAWQKWWTNRQGYAYQSPQTQTTDVPTIDQNVALDFTPSFTRIHFLTHSCFAAGTAVRTLEGNRPIESIRVGDQVLAQDPQSGALSFRPVVAIHHNPPNATLRVKLGDESIVATGIHRFWKSGRGWTMARDLKPGDTLRMLGGTSRVASLESDSVQPVFNLEVGGGHSFFVGAAGALVHDNSLVQPVSQPFDAEPVLSAIAGSGS
jgi:hypothetical protein